MKVYQNLCVYDPRNPSYASIQDCLGDEMPQPRNGCACDNCFNGLDALALQIIELAGALRWMVTEQEREGFGDEMPDIANARKVLSDV